MSDIVEFPNNAEHYYRKALNELREQHFDKAETLLLKSIALDYKTDAFLELVRLYITSNRKESLRELWDTYYPRPESRLEYEELAHCHAASIATLQLLQKALIELYRLRDYCEQQDWDTVPVQIEIEILNQHQRLEEELARAIANQEVSILLEDLHAAGAYSLLEHLKYLYTLPYEDCAPLYRLILDHPLIEQYIKSDVLHYFLNKKIAETLPLIWFGEPHIVSTGSLRPYNEQKQFLATLRAIQSYCEQYNPQLYDELIQQLTLQSMCFYPFINDVLHHPEEWVECMTSETIPDSPLAKKILAASDELFNLLEEEIFE
ncbi:hypothetical protein NHG29_05690 [Aerococcaceae bacterium NML160702]|nr:hypothetical protein [Aerococcaceae bacterium NML160702]